MTMNEFDRLCSNYGIAPAIALENNNVIELLLDIKHANSDCAKSGFRNCLTQVLEAQF
jgi:hypothetical protein